MKKVLFVINTLSRAGAETALMELLRRLDNSIYNDLELSLFVITGIGEMQDEIPSYVQLKNGKLKNISVLTKTGRFSLMKLILKGLFLKGKIISLFPYLVSNLAEMLKKKNILADKLLWRVLSEGADKLNEEYDLAIAFLEGASSYYVADQIKAKHKAAFVHVDYEKAGYTRTLDKNCYDKFEKIFCVSDEVKESFIRLYPEHKNKADVFENLLGRAGILEKSKQEASFTDDFKGFRILTIGRLTKQKALEVSIDAMKILKESDMAIKWYVLGEGDQRTVLEKHIKDLGLTNDFALLGKVENPYPYLRDASLYVHASAFEGKSIAIQEAKILGKPVLVTDCEGNRQQITSGVDGLMCDFNARAVADSVLELLSHPDKCKEYGDNAAKTIQSEDDEEERILKLIAIMN